MTFRKQLLAAARQARNDGELTEGQYQRLVRASNRPRQLRAMEELVVERGIASAEHRRHFRRSAFGEVDWGQLLSFLKTLLPLILKLMDLFS